MQLEKWNATLAMENGRLRTVQLSPRCQQPLQPRQLSRQLSQGQSVPSAVPSRAESSPRLSCGGPVVGAQATELGPWSMSLPIRQADSVPRLSSCSTAAGLAAAEPLARSMNLPVGQAAPRDASSVQVALSAQYLGTAAAVATGTVVAGTAASAVASACSSGATSPTTAWRATLPSPVTLNRAVPLRPCTSSASSLPLVSSSAPPNGAAPAAFTAAPAALHAAHPTAVHSTSSAAPIGAPFQPLPLSSGSLPAALGARAVLAPPGASSVLGQRPASPAQQRGQPPLSARGLGQAPFLGQSPPLSARGAAWRAVGGAPAAPAAV